MCSRIVISCYCYNNAIVKLLVVCVWFLIYREILGIFQAVEKCQILYLHMVNDSLHSFCIYHSQVPIRIHILYSLIQCTVDYFKRCFMRAIIIFVLGNTGQSTKVGPPKANFCVSNLLKESMLLNN